MDLHPVDPPLCIRPVRSQVRKQCRSEQHHLPAGAGDVRVVGELPQPVQPATLIPFSLSTAAHARLEVYDVLGRPVAVLINKQLAAGTYEATCDGRDEQERVVPSGRYLYRLEAGSYLETRSMLLVK